MDFLASIKAHNKKEVADDGATVPSPLVYDAQGLYAKRVWRDVFEGERDNNGRRVWKDAASFLLMATAEQKAAPIDFACGTGMRASNARVKPCERRFQRLFGNKRHQYHLVGTMRPRVIPETHFSAASAFRSALRGAGRQDDEKGGKAGLRRAAGAGVMEAVEAVGAGGGAAAAAAAAAATAAAAAQRQDAQSKTPSLWFAKEPTRQRGTGITVVEAGELRALGQQATRGSDERVFQRSVAGGNIACVDGRKADLRMYLLAEPSEEHKVYLYSDAVVRVAPQAYAGNEDASLESQLTNVAQGGDIIRGSEWEPFRSSFQAIQELLERVVLRLAPWFQRGRCELLGVDVMIDGSGRPWLIELNGSPSIGGHGTPLLFRPEMLRGLLGLAVYPLLRRHYADNASKLRIFPKQAVERGDSEWDLLCKLGKGSGAAKATTLDWCVRFAWLCDEPHHEARALKMRGSGAAAAGGGGSGGCSSGRGGDGGDGIGVAAAAAHVTLPGGDTASAIVVDKVGENDGFTSKGQVGLLMHPDVAGDVEHVLCYRQSLSATWRWDIPTTLQAEVVDKAEILKGALGQ